MLFSFVFFAIQISKWRKYYLHFHFLVYSHCYPYLMEVLKYFCLGAFFSLSGQRNSFCITFLPIFYLHFVLPVAPRFFLLSFPFEDFFLQVLNRAFDQRSSCIALYWKSKGRGINHRTDLRNTDPCSLLTRF